MRALITGITGFAGSHLTEYLLAEHPQVEVWGTYRWRSRMDNILHLEDRIRLVECDLRDATAVSRELEQSRPDYIFHLAAQSFVPSSWIAPNETLVTNVTGQVNLFEAVRSLVATGAGVHDRLQHTYGIVERFIPREVPAMRAARQQRGELGFARLNRLHVPVALVSMLTLPLLLLRLRGDGADRLALLAGSVSVALLTNAFVCGALSGPHDRYGARLAWLATLVVLLGIPEALACRAE